MVEDEPYEIEDFAIIVPAKLLLGPIVALEPTDQKTFSGWAPFTNKIDVVGAVERDVVIRKIHCDLGSPRPSRVAEPLLNVKCPDAEQ